MHANQLNTDNSIYRLLAVMSSFEGHTAEPHSSVGTVADLRREG